MRRLIELIALALCCCAIVLLEIGLTRLFSVTLWYHYAFLAISMTMLGLGIGGSLLFAFGAGIDQARWQHLWVKMMAGAGLSFLAALPIFLHIRFVPVLSWSTVFVLSTILVMFTIPFIFAGVALSLIFKVRRASIGFYYAVDLAGAAAGCLLVIPLVNKLGGISALLFVSVLFLLSGLIMSLSDSRKTCVVMTLVFLLVCGLFALQILSPRLEVIYVKGEREARPMLFEGWNAYSRIAVFPYIQREEAAFFEWGIDPLLLEKKPEQLLVNIDAGAATPITRFDGNFSAVEVLKYGVPSLVYHLVEHPSVLIIGPGGGNDILRALLFESRHVEAVEYNPLMYRVVNEVFGDFSGRIYHRPGVKFSLGEGRHHLQRSEDRFDIIQASLVDTFAASSAGALSLSENTLYTLEAFRTYLDHLEDDGILSISRFIHEPPWETLRIATTAREALRESGQEQPSACIAIVRQFNFSTCLIGKKPFSPAQRDMIADLAETFAFKIVWLTGHPESHPVFRTFMETGDPDAFYRDYRYDVRPVHDDSPFFFFVGKISRIFDAESFSPENIFHYHALYIVVFLFISVVILTILFMIVPLLLRSTMTPTMVRGSGLYFLAIGIAYMAIEVALIQRLVLPLGHPIHALTIVMVMMLAMSAAGSAVSSGITIDRRTISLIVAGIVLLLQPMVLAGQGIQLLVIGQEMPGKILLSALFIGPLAFLMGMPFPLGIRYFFSDRPNGIPWAWAVNGAASVCATSGAMLLAVLTSYTVVFLAAGVLYCAAIVSLYGDSRHEAS